MNLGWEKALEAQAEILAQIQGPFWKRAGGEWLGNRERAYGRGAMVPSHHALGVADEILTQAEPIYITEEMLDLTYTAMETFDRAEEAHAEDFFLRSGFVYLAKPHVIEDGSGDTTSWRAATWRYAELLDPSDERGPIPCLEILLWWHVDDHDGWDENHPREIAHAREILASMGWKWAIGHATVVPLTYMSDARHMANEGDPNFTWMTFVRVFNKLMGERIVLKTPMRPHRAVRRQAERMGLPEPKDVIVCELRRANPRGYEWASGDGEAARYSHRFMVAGHWRNQACGPKLSLRKQRWISPYVKGPDDAPFVDKKRVWVWDR